MDNLLMDFVEDIFGQLYVTEGEYTELTRFLDIIGTDDFGKWVLDFNHRGTREDPIPMPYVRYSNVVTRFENALMNYIDEHPEKNGTQYQEVLREYNIEWGMAPMKAVDVTEADDRLILALLVGAMRAEHFCDGALLGFFQHGCIRKWLERLKEIDERNDI